MPKTQRLAPYHRCPHCGRIRHSAIYDAVVDALEETLLGLFYMGAIVVECIELVADTSYKETHCD